MTSKKGKDNVREPSAAAKKASILEQSKGVSVEPGAKKPKASPPDPSNQKAVKPLDPKAKPDSKIQKMDSKGKVEPKVKSDPKGQTTGLNVGSGLKAEVTKSDAKGRQSAKTLHGRSLPEAIEQEEATQEVVPYVNPFKIDNVYAKYLELHPPPKPWSFDMSPPRPAKVKPVLDPFKWSKNYVHPWGEEKVKDSETIAEEERLAKLEAERLAKRYIRPCGPEDHHHKRVSIYCQPGREPIYKLDIYGNPKLDEAGHPIYEPVYMLNSEGVRLLDGAGRPIPVYILDEGGKVQLDATGNPIPGPTYLLDRQGNALLDEAGNLVPEPEHVDLLDAEGNQVLDEHGHPRHMPKPVYMQNAQGRVMLDNNGNKIPGQSLKDVEGNEILNAEGKQILGRFQYGQLDEEGLLVLDPEGDVILDAEGAPLLERQETTEEMKLRKASEDKSRKAKALQDKVEMEPLMMHTPLPKKRVPWRKYCATMYLPRSLKTVQYKDRGTPGDDWRYFVKKYTIAEMNHRLAGQLHGKTAVLWRKLHTHATYVQNPRYADERKQIKALRVFRNRETQKGLKCDLIDPHVLYFDGFEPGQTYIQNLRIYNVSPQTQRIRVVKPETPEYSITSTEEPFQGRNLVPGHKCDFDVIFQPPTVWKYEDVVTIKTEMQVLPLQLKAINPYPIVDLPTFVDMGLCLSGHSISYHYTLTSKGAGSSFRFNQYTTPNDYHTIIVDPRYDDLKQSYFDSNIQYLPPFVFYPRSFDTTADSQQEFIVLFRPPRAGVYHYIVQLTTITNLHWEIKFKGTAVDLKLNLQKIEGKDFNPGQAKLGLSFGQVTVSHRRVKAVTVKSRTALPLKFFWRIQDRHLDFLNEEDPECYAKARELRVPHLREFVPQPETGFFASNSETDIDFQFTPSDLANYHQVACLYVDTRSSFPLSSDLWNGFKETLRFVEYQKANWLADKKWDQRVLWGIDRSGFLCSNEKFVPADLEQVASNIDNIFHISHIENSGTVFRIAEIDLGGSGTQFVVEISPKVYQFSGILTVGETHLGDVEIINNSPTDVIFTWDRPKPPYGIVTNGAYVFPTSGRIGAVGKQSIQLTMRARKVGRIELELHCLVESPYHKGQLPLALKIEGHVVGPNVILSPSVLDFGLCQIDSTYSLEITLTNKSAYADAPFKIFSRRDSQIPFSSPSVPNSQLNPTSPNTKVPYGSGIFDEELQRKPEARILPPPPLVTLLPGYSSANPEEPKAKEPSDFPDSAEVDLGLAEDPHRDPHALCAPFYKPPEVIPPVNPLDREVSPEFLPAPQDRAWISRGYGEHLQVFNDGITDPKLPSTTLFQPRDPFARLPSLQPPKPVPQDQQLASGILQGISALMDKNKIMKPAEEPVVTSVPIAAQKGSMIPAPIETSPEVPALDTRAPPPTKRSSFIDTSFSHLRGLPAVAEHEDPPAKEAEVKKPFFEQMGSMGSLPKEYGPSGPEIHKTPKDVEIYEEDLRQVLVFEPAEGIVPKGNKSVTIRVTLTGTICGFMRLSIVCEISRGLSPTQYAIARAHIDAPEACVIPSFIDLRTKFINIPITISVVIRNLKALPACFSWPYGDRVGKVEDLDVEVVKQRGELPPRLEWGLTINLIPRKLGPLDTILICNVFKMINPLGLKLRAIIVDARISYHVFRPDREDGHQKSGRTVAHERILRCHQQEAMGNPVEEEDPDNWLDPPVPCLDFGRRRALGRAHCLRLLLCNHSPIEVKVQLEVGRYVTEPLASLLKDETWIVSSLTERLSYLIPNRRDPFQSALKRKERDKNSEFHLNSPALTDLSDLHLKYFSKAGKQMLWRRAEGAMHEALIKEGMPLAFLCYPSYTGVIKPWGDWSVEVVCFSNLPGQYMDVLTSKVGRLDPVDLPLEIETVGTPLVARRNWLEPTGLQQPDDEGEITVAWQPVPAGHHPVTRQFWVRNNSPFHMQVSWEFKRQATLGGKLATMDFVIEADVLTHAIVTERPEWYADEPTAHVTVKEHIGIVYDQQVHCVFRDYLETVPSFESPEEIPFKIFPQNQVILGHSSYPFEVRFFPSNVQSYSFILAGYQRIYDGRSTERRRSTQFVFDSTFDRKDEQYVYRRPEKKHVCEHVVTFYSKRSDSFVHTLAHKTSIVDPPDPGVRALQLAEDGSKPKRLSRFHCSEASNSSGSSSDDDESKLHKGRRASAKAKQKTGVEHLNHDDDGDDDASEFSDHGGASKGGQSVPSPLAMLLSRNDGKEEGEEKTPTRERAYSKVHDIAYESESEEEEPKYQFDIRRRSSRQRRVSVGRDVNFDAQSENSEADTYDPPEEKDWTTLPEASAIDLTETLATDQCKALYSYEAIRPLRVALESVVIAPRLKTNLDDSLLERVSFRCFGNDPPDDRFDVQSLFLTNTYAHTIVFNVYVPEPFDVMNIRRGVLQPVEHGDQCRRMSVFHAPIFNFGLEAGHTLQFNLSYRPALEECQLEPADVAVDRSFRIEFIDCTQEQIIPLHADLLFPELRLMADTISLGDVVTATDTQATDFSLSNPSLPDADWRIVTDESHMQTVALAAKGIPPKWEDSEGLNKIWPVIWSANPERGVVRGRRHNELGPSNEIQYYRNRNIVTVSFAPFDPVAYELVIWVEVRLGRGCRLTVKGTGVDEPPQSPPPAPIPAAEGTTPGKAKANKKGKEVASRKK